MERNRFSPDTIRLLEAQRQRPSIQRGTGDGECIELDPVTGERLGASDSRNDNGRAVGY